MNDNKLTSATVALAKQELDGVNFVDDDLLLFERFEESRQRTIARNKHRMLLVDHTYHLQRLVRDTFTARRGC